MTTLYNYDFETVWETAVASLLTAQNLTAGTSLTTDTLTTPRVDVKFETGEETDVMTPTAAAQGFSMIWAGTLTLTIITDRDRNSVSHSAYRATIRGVLAETDGAAWAAALGEGHRALEVSHVSTLSDVLDGEKALDASVMTYKVKFGLLALA